MNNIISNCPLCEEHSLHLMGQEEAQMILNNTMNECMM